MPRATTISAALALACATTADRLLVSHYTGDIYSLDFTNGTLTQTSSIGGCGKMPSWLSLDSMLSTLYCFDEAGAGQQGFDGGVVTSYAVNGNGSLSQSGQSNTKGGEVHGSPYGGSDGAGYIAMAEYDASTVTTYKLPLVSSNEALQTFTFTMSAPGPDPSRQDKPHPHSTITDPTGNYLLAPDLGADLIHIWSINATTGELTDCPSAATGPGDGPRHGTWWAPQSGSTTGQMLYTVNELGNSVSAWTVSYDSDCLSLNRTQTLATYPPGQTGPEGSKAAEVHVSGDFLYAANRNDETYGAEMDSMITYSIDATTGAISFLEQTNAHAWYPRTFSINAAGTYVAIGGQTSSNVAIVTRDPSSGRLGDLVASLAIATPGTDGGEDGLSAVVWNE